VPAIAFTITLGGLTVGSDARSTDAQLLRLSSVLSMDGAGGRCTLVLAATEFELPAPGDPLTVSLDAGEGARDVFTGEVLAVTATAAEVRVDACDGLSKLGHLEFEEVFAEQSAGAIARAVLDVAGLTAGTVADGPTFPSFVLHRGPRALHHLQRLARQCGVDLYTDGAGKVHFAGPDQAGASHSFRARAHVLAAELHRRAPSRDGVRVWGEGAASTQGAEKAHWLIDDLAGVSGQAAVGADGGVTRGSAGERTHTVLDGAVRTGQVAADLAAARALALAARRVGGHAVVLGAPAVVPGDTVTLEDLDGRPALAAIAGDGPLRVREVRHTLAAGAGFTTRVEF
jgi:hypothetical protein